MRISNTTVNIRVGYDKNGLPRLQGHHWANCRIAHLRPGAEELERRGPGRPKLRQIETEQNFKMASPFDKNDATDSKFVLTAKNNDQSATTDNQITQPRSSGGRNVSFHQPAAPADVGWEEVSPSHYEALNSQNIRVTGPPPAQPFQQQ